MNIELMTYLTNVHLRNSYSGMTSNEYEYLRLTSCMRQDGSSRVTTQEISRFEVREGKDRLYCGRRAVFSLTSAYLSLRQVIFDTSECSFSMLTTKMSFLHVHLCVL